MFTRGSEESFVRLVRAGFKTAEYLHRRSIRMREGQDASVVVAWVGGGSKAEVDELGRNLSSAFRGFSLDHENVRTPGHNGDVASTAEFASGIEPRRILGAGKEGHRGSI